MFTEEEIKQLSGVFTLARSFAAQNQANDVNLMKTLIQYEENIIAKIISTLPKTNAVTNEKAAKEEINDLKVEAAVEAPHNED